MIAWLFALGSLGAPQDPGPRLGSLQPAGATLGQDVAVTLRGERFTGAVGLLFDRDGIEVRTLTVDAKDRLTALLHVPPGAAPGPVAVRVHSAGGLSNPQLLHLGVLPALAETRDGEAPMRVPLEHTVDGQHADGSCDRYEVQVQAGQRVHVDVEAMRLGMVALDLCLVVRDGQGQVLARGDDSALGGRDPAVSFGRATDGVCTIEVASAVPGDGRSGAYRLHVGTVPQLLGAWPCGGRPGESLDVELLTADDPFGPRRTFRVQLPDDGSERFAWYPERPEGRSPTPVWLRVGGPPNQTPRHDAQGQRWLGLPAAVHDVVGSVDEVVRYRWRGQKGQEVEFRCYARTLRSALDPVLTLRTADGRFVASNDDTTGFDSVLRHTPTADGDFVVEVRDLLRSGSPQHVFRLEAGPRERRVQLSQQVARQVDASVVVPRGGHGALVVLTNGLDEPLPLQVGELPAGVTAEVGPRLPGSNAVPIVFTALAEAPLAARQVRVGIGREGGLDPRPFLQRVPLLTGRNDLPLVLTLQRAVPLAVREALPFSVRATAPLVPLVRGASLPLTLTLERAKGFTGRVRIRAAWLPPGVSGGQATFEGDRPTATLPLEATTGAACGAFPCLLVASVRVDNTNFETALPFTPLRIDEPWLDVARGTARSRQGQTATLRLGLTDRRPRQAAATAELRGLPRGVTAAPATAAAGSNELLFTLQVAADAAPGKHRDLVVDVAVPDADGRAVPHRFPAGELRIDRAATGERP